MPKLTVYSSEGTLLKVLEVKNGKNLLVCLNENDILINQSCSGNGTCKKCQVNYLNDPPDTCKEELMLGEEKLDKGIRLACRHNVKTDIKICVDQRPKMKILGLEQNRRMERQSDLATEKNSSFILAVDLGTTTLAGAFVNSYSRKVVKVYTKINSQRKFGSDVISRIQASNAGHGNELKRCIWEDILEFIHSFYRDYGKKKIQKIILSGNTVMEHLAMGYSCEGLGRAPFTPVSVDEITTNLKEILKEIPIEESVLDEIEVKLLPGFSAFVGADILSGLSVVDDTMHPFLFIDLGTNGEISLWTGKKLYVTATACGPAFEGAAIHDGVPGIEGAINSVNILGRRSVISTIGNKEPVGICGTGVVDIISELYKAGIMNDQGTFDPIFKEKGYPIAKGVDGHDICFYQEDVRQFQMAKSAIRSGIDVLLQSADIREDEIEHVYLAGGFGCELNIHKAVSVGLIPKIYEKKAEALGNTSLKGACAYALHGGSQWKKFTSNVCVINLATYPGFEERYIHNMNL